MQLLAKSTAQIMEVIWKTNDARTIVTTVCAQETDLERRWPLQR